MKALSLRKKIGFSILIIGVVAGIILAGILYFYLVNVLTDSSIETQRKITIEQTHETRANFARYELFAEMLGTRTRVLEFLGDRSEARQIELQGIFDEYAERDKNVLSIYLMDIAGLTLVSTDRTFIGQNYSYRTYFRESLAGRPYIYSAFGQTSNAFGFFLSYPVLDGAGAVRGVLAVKVNNKYFENALINSEIFESTTMMLVDDNGVVVYSNRPERFFSSLGPLDEETVARVNSEKRYSGRVVSPLQYDQAAQIIRNYQGSTSYTFYDVIDKEEELLHIERIGELPFFLVTEVELEELSRAGVFTAIFVGLFDLFLVLLLVGIIYILINRYVLRRLTSFGKTVEKISRGDFSLRAEVTGDDEVDALGRVINDMSDRLSHYYEDLDQQVKQQAGEIIVSNTKLETQQKAILNILKDIETEKQHLETVSRDLEKFKLAVDDASDHVVITDPEGLILYANKAVETITGFSPAETIGQKAGGPKLWGGLMGATFYEALWRTIKVEKKNFRGEVDNRRKNGELYTALASISPVLDKDNNLLFFVGIERDITEAKQAEERVHQALADLQVESQKTLIEKLKVEAIFESLGDGIVTIDQAGFIVRINDAALQMFALHEDEVVGHRVADVLQLVDEKGVILSEDQRPITVALSTGSRQDIPFSQGLFYARPDGSRFVVSAIVTPLVNNGRVVGAVETFRDASTEQSIDRAKTEFVSLASHQLRTPLSTINWYLEILLDEDEGKLNPKQKELLQEIKGGNTRMVELVNSLLNVSRIELGTFSVDPKPTNFPEIVTSVIAELEPQIIQKKLKVKQKIAKLPELSLDSTLIRIVVQNYLTNAVKYTPDGGSINVTVTATDKDFTFAVKDTGYGIPEDAKKKMFTKMFRADNVKLRDTTGTGLGLYIVKSIIEQSDGQVWFESVENKGTTFYFSLLLSGMKKKEGTRALT